MTHFIETTSSLETEDGIKLFIRACDVENERGRIVLSHGLGEHSGRYSHIIDMFTQKQISVWALDHRGHGQSEGIRGHVQNFQQYINDLDRVVDKSREKKADDIPFFLLGHSMGGLIAASYAFQHGSKLDGLILSSPGLGMIVEVPVIKSILGKLMSSLWPSLTLSNELDSSKISHDQHVVDAYNKDPLVHDRVSARWFTEYLAAMEMAQKSVSTLSMPILMQIAGDDHLVNARTSKEFFSQLKMDDKTLHVYDGLYHEIYNETKDERAKVLKDLGEWLDKRI